MVVEVEIKGIDETNKYLSNVSKKIYDAANRAIIKSGFYIQSEVQQSIAGHRAEPVSVDTGRFLNSVKAIQEVPLTASVATNVEYAEYLEYGTTKINSRPHFRNSAARNEVKVRDFVANEIKKIV